MTIKFSQIFTIKIILDSSCKITDIAKLNDNFRCRITGEQCPEEHSKSLMHMGKADGSSSKRCDQHNGIIFSLHYLVGCICGPKLSMTRNCAKTSLLQMHA